MPKPFAISLKLPFQEAIAQAAGRDVVLPADFYGRLPADARSQAFTVSGLASLEQIKAVLDSLAQALGDGQSFKEWQAAASGDLGGLSSGRQELVFRNAVQTGYSIGRTTQQRENKARRPFYMWDAINDTRTRPEHAAMDGYIAPIDDAIWTRWSPPAGHNSLLPWQRVSGNVFVGLKARYSGPIVEVVGKSGARLSVTAQHPVLTGRGWVLAQDIKVGDQLVGYSGPVGSGAVPADLDEHDTPPTIEEVFDALALRARGTMPRSALNLYGDVKFLDGDVEVVAANRELMNRIDAVRPQGVDHFLFALADKVAGLAERACAPFVVAWRELCRGAGALGGLQPAGCGTPHGHGDTALLQVLRQSLAIYAESALQVAQSRAVAVEVANHVRDGRAEAGGSAPHVVARDQRFGFRFGPLGNTAFADVFVGGLEVNPDALADILDAHPGAVEFEDVVDVWARNWTGHVYDLETASGNILAYGNTGRRHYVVSNCRCTRISLTEAQARARGYGTQERPTAKPDPGWDYEKADGQGAALGMALAKKSAAMPAAVQAAVRAIANPAPVARGTPVSDALKLPAGKGTLATEMREAMQAIDNLHGDGALPNIPALASRSQKAMGWYKHNTEVVVTQVSVHPRLTFAHEVGHFLDHRGWGGAGMSSESAPAAEAWRQAVLNSPEFQRLQEIRAQSSDSNQLRLSRYYTTLKEAWARSYAQWVATRSGDAKMIKELINIKADAGNEAYRMSQWGTVEFEPIGKAIDDLFAMLGWRHP
jgi:SPP1 gp7 family putative phage head morphogenesis protein